MIALEVRRASGLPVGVQILAGANTAAMAVADGSGASFVRVEGYVFAHVADEGLIESTAAELLRYRRAIGAERVRVFADIRKSIRRMRSRCGLWSNRLDNGRADLVAQMFRALMAG